MELTEVTGENWKQAVFLTTDPERKIPLDEKWIISNAFSLLQARYDPNWDCRLLEMGKPLWALLSTATGRSGTGIFCAGT